MLGLRPVPTLLKAKLRYDAVTAFFAVMTAAAVAAAVSFPLEPASVDSHRPAATKASAPVQVHAKSAACSERAWPYTCVYTAPGTSSPVRVITTDRLEP